MADRVGDAVQWAFGIFFVVAIGGGLLAAVLDVWERSPWAIAFVVTLGGGIALGWAARAAESR